jgi:PIN domain nuclease of toxin-antitoxin system
MASYLLDTCVVLWHFVGSPRIPDGVREVLTDPANDLLLSDVSTLEIVIKHGIGKLPLPDLPSRLVPRLARQHSMERLALVPATIFRLETLPPLHRDPFDRLLICQACEHRLQLITPDPLISQYDVACRWA